VELRRTTPARASHRRRFARAPAAGGLPASPRRRQKAVCTRMRTENNVVRGKTRGHRSIPAPAVTTGPNGAMWCRGSCAWSPEPRLGWPLCSHWSGVPSLSGIAFPCRRDCGALSFYAR